MRKHDLNPIISVAPESVTVTGPQKIRSGDDLVLECSSSASVPASSLRWRLELFGQEVEVSNPESDMKQLDDGSYVSRSVLSLPVISTTGHDLVAECYATNSVLGDDYRAYVHIVEVLCKYIQDLLFSEMISPLSPTRLGLHWVF